MSKGIFIEGITVEMFRNASLEAVEDLMNNGDMVEIEVKQNEWIPCSERLPSKEDCPMDCLVTRKSNFIGNYVDMAVAEANGTWTHEDWDAIVLGDVESGRKTGLISTRDDGIIAWMPLPKPYREDGEE